MTMETRAGDLGLVNPDRPATLEHGEAGHSLLSYSSLASNDVVNLQNEDLGGIKDVMLEPRSLPFGSLVRVTNIANGRSVVVRINDRGPFVGNRILDVSRRSAQLLGFEQRGTAPVRVAASCAAPATCRLIRTCAP